MTITKNEDCLFSIPIHPVKADIDGLGHTNNGSYVRWCEQIAWQHSELLGLSLRDYQTLDRAMVIVHADYDYLSATYLHEALELTTWLSDCDLKMRLQRNFELRNVDTGKLVFQGQWKFLCIEISSGKPKKMPLLFQQHYGQACIEFASIR